MAKPRVTATDRLANIIDVVELSRRTGLLSVERGAGTMLEEGEMYFVSGRAIYAMLAGLRGREALSMLARWGDCRFSFDTAAPRPAPNVSGGLVSNVNNPPSGALAPLPPSSPFAPSSRSSNTQGYPPYPGAPPPLNHPTVAPATPLRMSPYAQPQHYMPPADRPGVYSPSGQQPRGPTNTPQHIRPPGPLEGASAADSAERWGLPPGAPYIPGASGAPGGPDSGPSGPLTPFAPQAPYAGRVGGAASSAPYPGAAVNTLERRPRRAPDLRDLMAVVSSHRLTRSHRAILLLANGEHTVIELARLSSKPIEEVAALLQELEQHGLVYYY